MHTMILTAMILPGLLLAAPIAGSEEPPAETPLPRPPPPRGEPTQTGRRRGVRRREADDDNFVLPPGFKPMKRGKYTLYCRKETVMGTRLPAQKCYDEDGIRQLVQSLREEREKIDQMRRICGSMDACGGGG